MNIFIKKQYTFSIFSTFLACIAPVILITYFNDSNSYTQGRLGLLTIIIGIIITTLVALINLINFSYEGTNKYSLAFIIPIIIYVSIISYLLIGGLISNDSSLYIQLLGFIPALGINLYSMFKLKATT